MPELLANGLLGFLLGSIPFGLMVGYAVTGKDVRLLGSGKTGATNVLRTAGRTAAALVLLADLAKGAAPAVVGRVVFDNDAAAALGAAAAVVGHVWPLFAGFRGGRGVATAFGGIAGLAPLLSLAFLAVGAALLVPWRIVSVVSVVGTPICAAVVIALAALDQLPLAYAWYAVFALVLIEFKHVPNIRRLIAGTEPRLGRGGDRPATG